MAVVKAGTAEARRFAQMGGAVSARKRSAQAAAARIVREAESLAASGGLAHLREGDWQALERATELLRSA